MQRMIDTATWDDPWFSDQEPDAKLVFLYLLTNRRSTAAGAFEITLRAMEFETGIKSARIQEILVGFGDRVRWWPDHQIVWVRNFFRHQAANEKFTISAQRHVANLPVDVQRVIATVYPNLVPEGVKPDNDTHWDGYAMGIASNSSSKEGSDRGEECAGADAPADDEPNDPPKHPKNEPAPKPKPKPSKPMPRDGTAQIMLAVLYEDVLKIGPPTNYGQAVGQAQRFADAGATPLEVRRIAEWLLADPWQAGKGITITTVINSRDKWRAAQNAPKGGLTVHKTDRPIDAAEQSRREWRKRNGIPERGAPVADPVDDDVIETHGRIAG